MEVLANICTINYASTTLICILMRNTDVNCSSSCDQCKVSSFDDESHDDSIAPKSGEACSIDPLSHDILMMLVRLIKPSRRNINDQFFHHCIIVLVGFLL